MLSADCFQICAEWPVFLEQTYVLVAPSKGTVHDVYAAEVSAHTLSALLDLRRPYSDDVVTHRFPVDVRRPDEYTTFLHSVMAQWAETATSRLEPAAVTEEERCDEMSPTELARYCRRTRKQPLLRYAPYRIGEARKTQAAGRKRASGVNGRFAKVARRN